MSRRQRPLAAGPCRAALAAVCLAALLATPAADALAQDQSPQDTAPRERPPATECWRGWGYLLDAATGGYKSQEMLLVTIGAPLWEIGRPVDLYLLDRASGLISEMPSFTIVPENPRQYFRGRLNYMNTTAAIEGTEDRIVVGLSHIEPAKPGVPAKERYNRWACGFPEE